MQRFMDFSFVAAQRLVCVGDAHRAAKLHGHTFQVRITFDGPLNPDFGWVIDPQEMKAKVTAVLADLDHTYLNELPGLSNPSTEALCRYLQDRLSADLDGPVAVEIWENPNVGCATALSA